jgi:hypothetical protein
MRSQRLAPPVRPLAHQRGRRVLAAVVPGDRLGEGAVDIQSNDAHACSCISVKAGAGGRYDIY